MLLVLLAGSCWLWPVPLGEMPRSADHPVHLARAWMWWQALGHGSIRGWSDLWFFGTPIGELYPVLGDFGVVAIHGLGFGAVSWPTAYAWSFTIVFVLQGIALLRAGGAMGLGPWPGLVAAVAALVDVGAYREGGWIYTVVYGVWPQSLATSLTWLGLGELCRACRAPSAPARRRSIVWAASAFGLALLAHPMSMPVLMAGAGVAVVVYARDRTRGGSAVVTVACVGGLGLGLATFWLVPMLVHRAWMASYGWLWLPLDDMVSEAAHGRWCQAMPPMLGAAVGAGLVGAAFGRSSVARVYGATALGLWLLSSRDTVWLLRLDLLSEGFTHLQYQRFLMAAKPGLFLVAGFAAASLGHRVVRLWSRPDRRWAAVGLTAAGAGALGLAVVQQRAEWADVPPPLAGGVQLDRVPSRPEIDRHFADLEGWLGERWSERERFFRVTVRQPRNTHWYMDLPVGTGIPVFKQGFTPGDNFVHKPERRDRRVLDRANVRYEVVVSARPPRRAVASFGPLHVVERDGWDRTGVAWLEGPGQLHVQSVDRVAGRVEVDVSGIVEGTDASTRLVFAIAGYPRWILRGPSGEVRWSEAPVIGSEPAATVRARARGRRRGGKAHGDDGSEPTLIAADVGNGHYVLEYRRVQAADRVGWAVSLVVLGVLVASFALRGVHVGLGRVIEALHGFGEAWIGRRVLVGLAIASALAFAGMRIAGERSELRFGRGRLRWGEAEGRYVRDGYLKADMLIRPAIVVPRRHSEPARVTFRAVRWGPSLRGWWALDDDEAKLDPGGTRRVRIELHPAGGSWQTAAEWDVRHAPGRIEFDLPVPPGSGASGDVRVTVWGEGRRPPHLGFDLELEPEAGR